MDQDKVTARANHVMKASVWLWTRCVNFTCNWFTLKIMVGDALFSFHRKEHGDPNILVGLFSRSSSLPHQMAPIERKSVCGNILSKNVLKISILKDIIYSYL